MIETEGRCLVIFNINVDSVFLVAEMHFAKKFRYESSTFAGYLRLKDEASVMSKRATDTLW
jgi:hypothetical protein